MPALAPLANIPVPTPRPDEAYTGAYLERSLTFHGLKELLGAADFSKAGDRHAGLAARSEPAREVARGILSDLTLQHLYDRPLTDETGNVDSVMRVSYDIDLGIFAEIARMTLGEFKDHLLRSPGAEVRRLGGALTGVMAAALAKLCDVHELIAIARKVDADHQGTHAARRARHAVVAACSRTIRPTIRAASHCSSTGDCRSAPAMR